MQEGLRGNNKSKVFVGFRVWGFVLRTVEFWALWLSLRFDGFVWGF